MPWYLIAKTGTELGVTEHDSEELAILRANDIINNNRSALIQIEEVRGRLLRRQKIERLLVCRPRPTAQEEYYLVPYDHDYRAAALKWMENNPGGTVRVGRIEWERALKPRINLEEEVP